MSLPFFPASIIVPSGVKSLSKSITIAISISIWNMAGTTIMTKNHQVDGIIQKCQIEGNPD